MKLRVSLCMGLIVSVDVAQYKGKDTSLGQAIPQVPPSATLIVQYHIESSVGQHIMNDLAEVTVFGDVIKRLFKILWFLVSYASDRSTKVAPVTIPLW